LYNWRREKLVGEYKEDSLHIYDRVGCHTGLIVEKLTQSIYARKKIFFVL